ncbi:tRNA pseudouridine(55) synthase TruB [Sporosarcina gallistercoris]|uniref:tRNA pseudouridine synthase B n=1 Tax=Sporosarcina gallistercoris TaxID=2762245 RepID=A0ABR8PFZ4_9BACL|nr:tRNA pseudouridine(55) synthase TruB [Sporosarcina gallistercoris]MBD7907086.1 tRNA pseudouridine(55) synthase TruB [Sporosarcina gallistercoris]
MDGILPLWKEKGMTSHDCVFKLRKILRTKKVGHTGTLDPNVEGVLPICIGSATKVASYITDSGKEYIAEVSIGTATETEDADGTVVEKNLSEKVITRKQVLQVLSSLTGHITQIPPMYSAVKVNGRKLYEYARKGIEVERPERSVHIHEIDLLSEDEQFQGIEPRFTIKVRCGKGTYIRTLAVQIGERLGYPAHMSHLVRTASGSFVQNDCLTLDEVRNMQESGILEPFLRPLETALDDIVEVHVEDNAELLTKILNGQVLPLHPIFDTEPEAVFSEHGRAIAVYAPHPEKAGLMKPVKMFLANRGEEGENVGNN